MKAGEHADGAAVCPDCDAGLWLVHTESGSIYMFDLDERTLLRVPVPEVVDEWLAAGNERTADDQVVLLGAAPTPALRRDGLPVPVLKMSSVTIGERVEMVLQTLPLHLGGTIRISTPVTRVDRIKKGRP